MSLERYKQGIAERLPNLLAMQTRDVFRVSGTPGLADNLESEVRRLRLDCHHEHHVLLPLNYDFDRGLIVAQAMHDIAAAEGYDQNLFKSELEIRLK